MGIKHEAFLDLENALITRLQGSWSKQGTKLFGEIEAAIDASEYDRAHTLVDSLDLSHLAEKQTEYFKTIGMSAVLLGASRLVAPKKSSVYKKPPTGQLDNAVKQIQLMLSRNATQALREEAHLMIHQLEYAEREEMLQKAERSQVRVQIRASTDAYIGMASSLHISRLASFGFLAEALDTGLQMYQVSAVLDGNTCPVCRNIMHGKRFPVSAGVSHAESIMQADDPDFLRTIAPWPKRDKASLDRLGKMSVTELIDGGLSLPPYHPACRCIIVKVGDKSLRREIEIVSDMSLGLLYGDELVAEVSGQLDDRIAIASRTLYGSPSTTETSTSSFEPVAETAGFVEPTQRVLGDRLIGDRSDLYETAENFSVLSGIGIGVLLGTGAGLVFSGEPAQETPKKLLDDMTDEELAY